jgi:hypothetical protein
MNSLGRITAILFAALAMHCSSSPHVWVLGDDANAITIKFDKAPKRFFYKWNSAYSRPGNLGPYKTGKTPLRFELPAHGDYAVEVNGPKGAERISFEAHEEFKIVTVIDAAVNKHLIVQDVSALYDQVNGLPELPITQISPPAKVHQLNITKENSHWAALKLPQYAMGFGKKGETKIRMYKVFALEISAAEAADKKSLEDRLRAETLALELKPGAVLRQRQ